MPKLPRVSGAEAIRALAKLGFLQVRSTRQSRCSEADRFDRRERLRGSAAFRACCGHAAWCAEAGGSVCGRIHETAVISDLIGRRR